MSDDSDYAYPEENRTMIAWMSGKSPEHRHFIAMHLNWDYAEMTLDWVVGQSDCDLATAVELFWLANPDELICYPTRDSFKDYEEWAYGFVKYVIDRAGEGGYGLKEISYNLDSDLAVKVEGYREVEDECRDKGLPWIAPREFRIPFQGFTIDIEGRNPGYWSEELDSLFEGLGTRFA